MEEASADRVLRRPSRLTFTTVGCQSGDGAVGEEIVREGLKFDNNTALGKEREKEMGRRPPLFLPSGFSFLGMSG